MAKCRGLLAALAGSVLLAGLMAMPGVTVHAGSGYLDTLNGGVSAILDPGAHTAEVINDAEKKNDNGEEEKERFHKVMANVGSSSLNIRSEASEDSEALGKLYKDCGGTILERGEEWTRIQSGNLIGWAKNEFLLFDEDAIRLAKEVGKTVACMNDVIRARKEPSLEAEVYGVLPKGEIVDVILPKEGKEEQEQALYTGETDFAEGEEAEWVCIDYNGEEAYVSAKYVTVDFIIDTGETSEEIKAREEAEAAAKKEAERHKNYGEYTTDADTTLLLAALIQCEAGGESYEGKVAVGAVVMNRVRSSAYPDTIHGVIYASGQFTPAMSGKLNRVYESGKISEDCINAAKDALSGTSPVGDLTHFRRNDGRDGLVIGHHVFY